MKKILFVCTGNTCRSPMAEALFNAFAKKQGLKMRASSAGMYVSSAKVEDKARTALKPMGVIIRHKPTQITRKMFDSADLVLTMTEEQKFLLEREVKSERLQSIAGFINGIDISDPYGLDQSEYDQTAKLLEFSVKSIIKKMEN